MKLHNAHLINRPEARALAVLLRDAGFTQVSQKRCNDYVCNVVAFYAGADPAAQREVHGLVNEACGFGEPKTEDDDDR